MNRKQRRAQDKRGTVPTPRAGSSAVEAMFAEGLDHHRNGRLGDAERLYRQTLAADPRHADSLHLLGVLAGQSGRPDQAVELIGRAIAIDSKVAAFHFNLGNTLQESGRRDEAVASYQRAIALEPDDAETHFNLGIALKELGRLDEAVASLGRAAAIRPDYAEAHFHLGYGLEQQGRLEQAVACYRQAIAVRPDYADAYCNLGNALIYCGRADEVQQAFAAALRLAPRNGRFHWSVVESRRVAAGDPQIAAMEALAADPGLPEDDRMQLHFALGKALDDAGDPARAFEHMLQGNALKRARISYDEGAALAWLQRIAAVFSMDLRRLPEGIGDPSSRPVFIVGMPRSGTSLIEQVLASHPQAFGAGECRAMPRVAAGLAAPFPDAVPGMTVGQLQQVGAAYLAEIGERARDAVRVVDKMPGNFALVGLIHLVLPNARIVHAVRDPVDTCLSCFSKLFAEGQPFAYDLAELGRYWRGYQALMRHWHAVLPPGVMIDLRYEDLVSDFEGQVRRLLDHCRLDWDPACLEFHRTRRVVSTASTAQVRMPLYASSVGRWQAYGRQRLQPLLDALQIDRS